jgi:threonine dehydratase
MNNKKITLGDVLSAQKRITNIITKTPLRPSLSLSEKTGKNVYLKLENMQPSGSFKLRGAANAILSLSKEKRGRGVITMSAGNHGKAVAYVANKTGIKAIICLSELVPGHKVEAIQKLGAEVIIAGKDQDDATEEALTIARKKGLTFISAFDDPWVIAGQGTIALEILKKNPKIDTMLVQLSGGGLMSGISITAKSINPNIELIGVTIEQGAAMYESIKAGKIVAVEEVPSLADALQGGLPFDNQYTFDICRQNVDNIICVPEEHIEKALSFGFRYERLVLEGSGAITLAPLLYNDLTNCGENIAVILSGDNVDINQLLEIVVRHTDL